jgi:hypothetical protein
MNERSPGSGSGSGKWKGLIATAGLFSGAIATVAAAFIANKAGALNISVDNKPGATVTITPSPAPTVTVTVSPNTNAPGPFRSPNCPASLGCQAWNLVVHMTPGGSTGIDFGTGTVQLQANDDMYYSKSPDGTLELTRYSASAFSTAVTPQNAGRETCQNVTASDPDPNPIANFHQGLLFCVDTGQGVALVEETKPVGSDQILNLREFYWPKSP